MYCGRSTVLDITVAHRSAVCASVLQLAAAAAGMPLYATPQLDAYTRAACYHR
jgi:hypothetical protein